jgi:peptide/nickel transport system permease protein
MFTYIVRRILYAIPILLVVNMLLFTIFFVVNSPERMAQQHLGEKRATPERIVEWKQEHNYHLPRFLNMEEEGFGAKFTQTIFWQKSMSLFWFNFGSADSDQHDIASRIKKRIPYSLCLTLPQFIVGIFVYVFLSMIVAFYRGTYIDTFALVICVVSMSIAGMIYVVGGQFIFSQILRLAPISGFDRSYSYMFRFLMLPIAIGMISGLGGNIRYYRTVFLEEINKDYIRTARAKGLGEGKVLFKHALKNAMLPILTSVIVSIPFLIMGSMVYENFFGIPGIGGYLIDGIQKQDFAVTRAMVFLGALLYVAGLVMVDISYSLVDPRIRIGGKK